MKTLVATMAIGAWLSGCAPVAPAQPDAEAPADSAVSSPDAAPDALDDAATSADADASVDAAVTMDVVSSRPDVFVADSSDAASAADVARDSAIDSARDASSDAAPDAGGFVCNGATRFACGATTCSLFEACARTRTEDRCYPAPMRVRCLPCSTQFAYALPSDFCSAGVRQYSGSGAEGCVVRCL